MTDGGTVKNEAVAPTDTATNEPRESFSLLGFYQRNGIGPGGDLFVVGPGSMERAGEHAALHTALGTEEGPLVKKALVLLPPGSRDGQIARFERGYRECSKRLGAPEGATIEISPRIEIEHAASLDVEEILTRVRNGSEGTTLIVPLAARYRSALPLADIVDAPEDVWVPQLTRTAELAVTIAFEKGTYLALDAGEWWPERESHRQLLLGIENCGVASAEASGISPLQLAATTKSWRELAGGGRLSEALAEIDRAEGIAGERLLFERAWAFKNAGHAEEAAALLRREMDTITSLPAEPKLGFGEFAHALGQDAIARDLLRAAVGELSHVESLQGALRLADAIDDHETATLLETKLRNRFPRSRLLAHREAEKLITEGRRDQAAVVLATTEDPEFQKEAAYQQWLSDRLAGGTLEPESLLTEAKREWPDRSGQTLQAVAHAMERGSRREDALDLLLSGPEQDGNLDQATLWSAIEMFERGLLSLDQACDSEMAAAVVGAAVRWLSRNPTDGWTRMRLITLLSPEMLGGVTSAAVIAKVAMDFGQRELGLRPSIPIQERARPCDIELLPRVLEAALQRFSQEPAIILGRMEFPKEELPAPPEQVVAGFLRMVEHAGEQLSDKADEQVLENCLVVATAIAPLGSQPNDDLILLRSVAGRLAISGRTQRARDLAEQALSVAGDDPHRVRIAWYTYGDIYARSGNAIEGLVGLACALAADDEADWDQVWYESYLWLRLFRDLGLIALARPVLKTARRALREVGLETSRSYWLDSIDLQIRLAELDRNKIDSQALAELIDKAAHNLAEVLDANDDGGPPTVLLAQLIRIARGTGMKISSKAEKAVAEGMARLGDAAKALVEISGNSAPTADQLAALARRTETARYSADVGFDVRHLVLGARRMLASGLSDHPDAAAFAIEAMADHALRVPKAGDEAHSLVTRAGGPSDQARALAVRDLSVILLGLAENGLTRVEFTEGKAAATVETEDVFSRAALTEWSTKYPYAYKGGSGDTSHAFYTSTEKLGLSGMPSRAVLVATTDLQGFPPNLLQVGRELAGVHHRLALAPSLEWLGAARNTPMPGDHRIVAWIPHSASEGSFPALAVLADRLKESFDKHGVALGTGSSPSRAMAGAGLAIIAAHGGVGEDTKFFRVLTDDADLALAASDFSSSLTDINVVVLFVCSGGRLDKHPAASTTVGLVKQLLDRGCRAVIAPPWPLDTSIPPIWLPAFLERWANGEPVIDACFEANQSIRDARGPKPVDDLAMTVYGDPLVRSVRVDGETGGATP